MTSHIPEELSTRIDWSPFAIMGMPPRDPDEDKKTRTKRKRTAPTNRRSCASRTKIKQDVMDECARKAGAI